MGTGPGNNQGPQRTRAAAPIFSCPAFGPLCRLIPPRTRLGVRVVVVLLVVVVRFAAGGEQYRHGKRDYNRGHNNVRGSDVHLPDSSGS